MTARERSDLVSIIRQSAKVLKAAAKGRSAELLADFEEQLGTIYHWDQDATWAQAHELAAQAAHKASETIARRCAELGIPQKFAPQLHVHWYERGESASASRRAELRKMATAQIAALEAKAITQIERDAVETQTAVVADGLTSTTARSILDRLPSVQSLMPPVDAHEVIKKLAGETPDDGECDDAPIGLLRSPSALRSARNRRYYEKRKKLLAAPQDGERLSSDGSSDEGAIKDD